MNDGDRVKLSYVKRGHLPSTVSSDTIYILEEFSQIYVGDKLVASVDKPILYNTTAGWNSQPRLISKRHIIYMYTDHTQIDDVYIPGFKVGDGTSYLIDMPFIDQNIDAHIADTTIHITQAEREKWDNKVSVSISALDPENLIFTNG